MPGNHAGVAGDVRLSDLLEVLRESIFETLEPVKLHLAHVFERRLHPCELLLTHSEAWLHRSHLLLLL